MESIGLGGGGERLRQNGIPQSLSIETFQASREADTCSLLPPCALGHGMTRRAPALRRHGDRTTTRLPVVLSGFVRADPQPCMSGCTTGHSSLERGGWGRAAGRAAGALPAAAMRLRLSLPPRATPLATKGRARPSRKRHRVQWACLETVPAGRRGAPHSPTPLRCQDGGGSLGGVNGGGGGGGAPSRSCHSGSDGRHRHGVPATPPGRRPRRPRWR